MNIFDCFNGSKTMFSCSQRYYYIFHFSFGIPSSLKIHSFLRYNGAMFKSQAGKKEKLKNLLKELLDNLDKGSLFSDSHS